jgi:hypothetical protein
MGGSEEVHVGEGGRSVLVQGHAHGESGLNGAEPKVMKRGLCYTTHVQINLFLLRPSKLSEAKERLCDLPTPVYSCPNAELYFYLGKQLKNTRHILYF